MLAGLGASKRVQAQLLGVVTAEPNAAGGLSDAIPAADGAAADVANKILVVRTNNAVYAFSLAHAVRREGDRVVVDVSVRRRTDLEAAAWTAAVVKLPA